jgi:hypothetical protein
MFMKPRKIPAVDGVPIDGPDVRWWRTGSDGWQGATKGLQRPPLQLILSQYPVYLYSY